MILKIGTRGSKLALKQSEWVKGKIEARYPHVRVELVRIKTTGDKILDSPLSRIGGKGLFVKEIEDALLENRVDLAVHSMKDVPAELPDRLILSTFPEREDPADALISVTGQTLDQLPPGAKVGTSSLRRGAQLLHIRPDLRLVPLRGNVDTRLRKLESGDLHAVILATAGLRRLGLSARITQIIPFDQVLPAIGQGALGLEVRRNDAQTINLLDFLNHEPTKIAVSAERAFLKELKGGCQVPIAGLARLDGNELHFEGMVAELDGTKIFKEATIGVGEQAEEIGIASARRLLASGADRILGRIYGR
ncbi:MAG: hydroxymethylbilane synthase [Proteobacteria bacterium]|nr:hydroxymethylbilane synthase [Pseudomonadota bacterium]MBU1904434.1 hydroxymethylbilane synthase [Pseudomonadota bacterium]